MTLKKFALMNYFKGERKGVNTDAVQRKSTVD